MVCGVPYWASNCSLLLCTTAGKSLGTDLRQLKPTLPLIRCLETADDARRAQIMEVLQGEAGQVAERLRRLFEAVDAIAYTRKLATSFATRAVDELAGLPPSPAATALRSMAEFVARRAF